MTKSILEDRRAPWILSALICVLFLITNLPWQLDDYDQAKQAYTSFEMVKEGHWLYQHTPHEKIATKPPLVGWMSAGLSYLTRSWDIAWRLPSFLAAVALAILIFRAAASMADVQKHVPPNLLGLIALSAFGFNLLGPRLATLVRTDMPLALVIFLIGLQIWKHAREKRGWNSRDRFWLFVLLTAAMLIKGPIVYAFLLPGILVFVWWVRQTPTNDRGCGWWPWVASLSIFLIWVAGGIVFQPGFYEQVVMREFVGRFGETIHRPQPFYFYLPHLLHKFAPWSVLMIALAVIDLRALVRLDGFKPSSLTTALRQRISPETFWLICWAVGGLVVMSLIPSKRVDRIFPVIPPLCMLLAAQVAHTFRRSHGLERGCLGNRVGEFVPAGRSAPSSDSEETAHRAVATEDGQPQSRVFLWVAIALAFSILFTGIYSMSKIITGYRNHRNALVVFSRDVLAETEKHHWRYEVVRADDEGLLLYLDRTHFIKPDQAIADWNAGKLDALVAAAEDAPALVRDLQNATLSSLKSETRKEERDLGYVLITR